MSKTTFRVGDRVRIAAPFDDDTEQYRWMRENIGAVGQVEQVTDVLISVVFDGTGEMDPCYPEELELVTDAQP